MTSHRFARIRATFGAAILLAAVACDQRAETPADPPAAAAPNVDTALAVPDDDQGTRPDEIYFDLTAFTWYREGRPLVHAGRRYMPQAEPVPVQGELSEAGRYEGVAYYVMEGAREPFYTIYVPVYYRYWQRFTAPPGS